MSGRTKIRTALLGIVVAGGLTALVGTGLLERADLAASDALYQHVRTPDDDILLMVIDQKALEAIGPYEKWGRDVIAAALETLNQSEEERPAVIGIDVIFSGETDEGADQWLAEMAGRYDNVVTAGLVKFGDRLEEDGNGDYRLASISVTGVDMPYDALQAVTEQGHVNAALDPDGVLRHHLLSIALPDGKEMPSLALAVARRYREIQGGEPLELPPTQPNGLWYLPFCDRAGGFDTSTSLADLVSGNVLTAGKIKGGAGDGAAVGTEAVKEGVPIEARRKNWAGKIVLIGPYEAGLRDSYTTAIDHENPMFGVEYQANAIQAMLWGNYKKEVSDRVQLLLLFAVMLLCLAGYWRRPVRSSTVLWVGLCGGSLLLCRLFYHLGWVFHVLWIPVGATVLYAGCLALNYIQAAMERRHVTNTFKRYVAPEIVNELLKEGTDALELGGKLTKIAVLFVDVRGFTPMSELLKPTEVVEILNQYLTLISRCILKNSGTLDKFVGDAAMAFWGAPLPQEDYVMKAVQAAVDMAEGSQSLSKALMEQYGRTVSFGIGVHVGDAVVGNVGSPERMDYTAIGDTVNTAARLEANAPAGTIYISRAVADALEGRILTTSLGDSVKLKGKKEGFEVLRMEEIL